jgi:hypothetical protein
MDLSALAKVAAITSSGVFAGTVNPFSLPLILAFTPELGHLSSPGIRGLTPAI